MRFAPWQLLAVIVAGWMSQRQQQVIDYLREENRVLREKLGKKRIRLNDGQRRRLAAKGKVAPCGSVFESHTMALDIGHPGKCFDLNLVLRTARFLEHRPSAE